jgi:quinol---cytochrome-c reductase cytochrome c subunit
MTRVAPLLAFLALALAPVAAADPPPPGLYARGADGKALYAANCSSCHGSNGEGVVAPRAQRGIGGKPGLGPPLRGVGPLAADFFLRTGYMPLSSPWAQPTRSHVLFDERQLRALVAYVASLGKGPAIPTPHPERGYLARGMHLFTEHCAGCHQVVAEGGYVTGARVPPLEDATPVQIAEAVRIGPYVMPRFSPKDISDSELDSIIRYVQYAKRPHDPGGWAIGHLGPFPEGLVTWLIGGTLLVGVCVLIGKRATA